MSPALRYTITIAGVLLFLFLIWYFSHIVVYVLVSLVLALIGRPVFDFLGRLRLGKLSLPASVRSLLSLVVLVAMILSFFGLFIPLLASKINDLSSIDPQTLVNEFRDPLTRLEQFINHYKLVPNEKFSAYAEINNLLSRINFRQVAAIFGSVANWLGDFSVAVFSIAFITFFFLKDEKLFSRVILSVIPDKHADAMLNALVKTRSLLTRYFTGLLIEITAVTAMGTGGLMIIGFSLRDSLLVGFMAGVFNIIPYLGPFIGSVLGIFTGLISYLLNPMDTNLTLLLVLIVVVFMVVQFIDNMLIQPYVFSNSVNAHPLEIFLVFLMAGSLGGLAGMIVAVPAYTVLRVFAREFFNQFKLVRSLTKNL